MFGTQMRTMGLVAGLAVGFASTADAHGPTRKKVIETVTISAAPDKVWAVMGNFQDMSWLPGVKSTTGTGGNSVDPKNDDNEVAKRTVTLSSGGAIMEGLYKYNPAEHSYSYRIDKVDVKVLDDLRRQQGRRQALRGGMARRLLPRLHEQRSAAEPG